MKYINILEPIEVNLSEARDGKEVISTIHLNPLNMYEYLSDSDDQFNRDLKGTKSSVRIDAAIRKAKAEKLPVLALEDEDWKRLKAAAESPSNGYPIRPAKRIQPFIEAVVEAKDSPPAVMEPEESKIEESPH